MNGTCGGRARPRRPPLRRAGVLPAALAGIALLAAACGSPASSAAAPGGSLYAKALAFTQCMRSHGEAGYPDPTMEPGGAVAFKITPGSGLDVLSAQYQSARKACGRLLAGHAGLPAGLAAKALGALVKYAGCMRSHGIPNFPDPVSNGRGISFPPMSGVSPRSKQFQSARQACRPFLPGGVGP